MLALRLEESVLSWLGGRLTCVQRIVYGNVGNREPV